MITFITLLASLLALAIIATIVLTTFGAGFLAVFGDLVVFGLIVGLIIRRFGRRK